MTLSIVLGACASPAHPCELPTDCLLRHEDRSAELGGCSYDETNANAARRDSWDVAFPVDSRIGALCLAVPFPTGLVPTCERERCAVFDLSASTLAACTTDSDCARFAVGCGCTSPNRTPLANSFLLPPVALRRDSSDAYLALVCPTESGVTRCPEVEPGVCVGGRCQ